MSSAASPRLRRPIKVRGGNLGAFLCWAVIFADIGTSVYYVPGILYGPFGSRAALFVLMTLFVFVLLCIKYAEVTWRYPEGGGVVNVASQALHPFAGMLGGLFILVDYYLTAALSALSGALYLGVVMPFLTPWALHAAVVALIGLALLNLVGIRESARTTAVIACLAGAGQLAVVAATAVYLGPAGVIHSFSAITQGPSLTPVLLITGYGAAFLAFSGLESVAQLAPAMREPRRKVAYRAMAAVVLTMAITSPLLTLWSTTLLKANADPNQFISLLGTHTAVLLPIIVIVASQGSVVLLGDLYSFGLLGTFVLTCISLDLVRWRERARWKRGSIALFAVGVLTTVLVISAWAVNLLAKPLATEFGGGLTVIGLIAGFATYGYYRRRRPAVFPVPFRPERAAASIASALGNRPSAGEVM